MTTGFWSNKLMPHSKKQFLTPEAWADFRRRYESSDDRSCAILNAAYIDDCLYVLIRSGLIGTEKTLDHLLSDIGPLSSFSAKINLAFCLNLIHDTVYRDLHLIRRIRNEFAHGVADLTFSIDPVRSWCFSLDFPKEYFVPEDIFDPGNDPRQDFVFTCAMFTLFFEGQYFQRTRKLKELLGDLEQLASIPLNLPSDQDM